MNWRVDFSADSLKFLIRNKIDEIFIVEKNKICPAKISGRECKC